MAYLHIEVEPVCSDAGPLQKIIDAEGVAELTVEETPDGDTLQFTVKLGDKIAIDFMVDSEDLEYLVSYVQTFQKSLS